ncbi:OmpA family protein [Qingshengfaniella alkalisoli]|nr:OmpA family protein [Qingshengfaniella alkalisoli]
MRQAIIIALMLSAPAIHAMPAPPKGSTLGDQRTDPSGLYSIATGPTLAGHPPETMAMTGVRTRQVSTIPSGDANLATLLNYFRQAYENDGLTMAYQCADIDCGGFDFRDSRDVLPPPEMYVDLGNFMYASFASTDSETLAELILSTDGALNYIHISEIIGQTDTQLDPAREYPKQPSDPWTADNLLAALRDHGHVALAGLTFQSGASRLTNGTPQIVMALADALKQTPSLQIALVGHTDSVGSADGNQSLSRNRAQTVANLLTSELGVNSAQITVGGVGFFSPIASNATDEGRDRNRRVEAVLLGGLD